MRNNLKAVYLGLFALLLAAAAYFWLGSGSESVNANDAPAVSSVSSSTDAADTGVGVIASTGLPLMFTEGTHYKVLDGFEESSTPLVTEVFWLGCGHCYSLEPLLEQWLAKQSSSLSFERIPAMFGRQWVAHAHLYFIAESLGVAEKMVPKAFDEIHVRKNSLLTKAAQKQFLVGKVGIKAEDFDRLFGSDEMQKVMEAANAKVIKMGLTGVPTIIVNNKYLVDGKMAGGQPKMLEVVDFLLAK